jgi:hypothetical protein
MRRSTGGRGPNSHEAELIAKRREERAYGVWLMARDQRIHQRQQRLCFDHVLYAIGYTLFSLARYASPFDRLTVLSRVEGRDTIDEERSGESAIAAETLMNNAG